MATGIVPTVFDSDEFGSVRVVNDGGEIWFAAIDVAHALGYRDSDKLTRNLSDDEVTPHLVGDAGSAKNMPGVSEAGFYHAVLQRKSAFVKDPGRREMVERFQRWVTHEVIPSIRRDGGYMVSRPDETPEETMARAVLIAQHTIERQRAQIAELKPKALFADAVAASDGTCLVGELAKMLRQNGVDVGQNRLFAILREQGFLGKAGGNYNVPTQRAMDLGLFRIKETAVTHSDGHVTITRTPKVTGKGQRYFIERFSPADSDGGDAA
jgi:anti-repressor protein